MTESKSRKRGRPAEQRFAPRVPAGPTSLALDHEDRLHGWSGKAIKWFRVGCLGLTKTAFAELFDPPSSDRQIRRWENGSHIPNTHMIEQLDAMAREVYFDPRRREQAINLLETLGDIDGYSKSHSIRVAEFSIWIARLLGMSRKERAVIGEAAFLHDIGKLGVAQKILQKPDKLNPDEYAEMQRHVLVSRNLALVFGSEQVAQIVYSHHERMDGSGYPSGTTSIPIAGRILAVADTFEAMSAYRSYRKRKFTPLEIVETLHSPGYDQEVANLWLRVVAAKPEKITGFAGRMQEAMGD
jgi:HD-GYP domain-containing protein (c-di-GMP phosphodiesterase class II)